MLTDEQRKMVEDNMWIVNTVLKLQGVQTDEDLRQQASLYMCRCVERFDPSKGVQWTTYAYKNVYMYVKRVYARAMEKRSQLLFSDELFYLCERKHVEEFDEAQDKLDELKKICSDEEKVLLSLKGAGFKSFEISEIMKCSPKKMMAHVLAIKEKAKEICESGEEKI